MSNNNKNNNKESLLDLYIMGLKAFGPQNLIEVGKTTINIINEDLLYFYVNHLQPDYTKEPREWSRIILGDMIVDQIEYIKAKLKEKD